MHLHTNTSIIMPMIVFEMQIQVILLVFQHSIYTKYIQNWGAWDTAGAGTAVLGYPAPGCRQLVEVDAGRWRSCAAASANICFSGGCVGAVVV